LDFGKISIANKTTNGHYKHDIMEATTIVTSWYNLLKPHASNINEICRATRLVVCTGVRSCAEDLHHDNYQNILDEERMKYIEPRH
jgi:hypothetical protein